MTEFWIAFWPNLASTLVGVLLGVPLALWINRSVVTQGETARREGERLRVAHALRVLNKALTDNRTLLQDFAATLAASRTKYDSGLDTSAWDAVKSDLTTELSDPELRQRLAYHFSRLTTLVKMNEEYLYFIDGVGASMTSATETRKTLHNVVSNLVAGAEEETSGLVKQIDTEHQGLTGKALARSAPVLTGNDR